MTILKQLCKVDNMKFSERKTSSKKKGIWWKIILIFLLAALAGFLDYPKAWDKTADWIGLGLPHFINMPFKLGLDLQGGTHLVYDADLSQIDRADHIESIEGVRDVIELRVNAFGVAEPVVQINQVGEQYRLIVELAGVRDIGKAVEMIGQTPSLDFREPKEEAETNAIIEEQQAILAKQQAGEELSEEDVAKLFEDPYFKAPELTGRFLENANVSQDQTTFEYQVNLQFDSEGAKLFEEITDRNTGKPVAIYLDGSPISTPVVQEKIIGAFPNKESIELYLGKIIP